MRPKLPAASLALVATLVACGDGPPAASPASPPPPPATGAPPAAPSQPIAEASRVVFPMVAQAACVMRGGGVSTGMLPLTLHGKRFAYVSSDVEWAEAHFAAGQTTGTIVGRTSTVDFAAEMKLESVAYTTRSLEPVDGWIVVEEARAREVTPAGELVGIASLPRVVVTGSSTMPTRHRCDEVTLGWARAAQSTGSARELRRGAKGTLRDGPSGRVLARLEVPPMPPPGRPADHYAPFYAAAFEQRGSMTRVAIRDMGVRIEGWTETSLLVSDPRPSLAAQASLMQLETLAAAASGTPSPSGLRCSRPVSVFVRDGGDRVVVGSLRPGAEIRRAPGGTAGAPGEMPVSFGRAESSPLELTPFVLESDLAACNAGGGARDAVTAVAGRGLVLGPVDPLLVSFTSDLQPSPAPPPSSSGTSARQVSGPKAEVVLGVPVPSDTNRDRALTALRPRFRQCYQVGLNGDPSMAGRLIVALQVDASGQVLSATVTSNAGLSSSVVSCVSNAIRRATPPAGSPVTVSVPLTFVAQAPR